MGNLAMEQNTIDRTWFEAWGESIGAASLGIEMSENSRLKNRLYKRLMKLQGIDSNIQLPQEDANALGAFGSDRERLKRISGLVMLGDYLRKQINQEDFSAIGDSFASDDLRIALQLLELSAPFEGTNIDNSRIVELTDRLGEQCLASWKLNASEDLAKRIAMIDPNDDEVSGIEVELDQNHAAAIINSVSFHLNQDLQISESRN